jgi:hypothetical protein
MAKETFCRDKLNVNVGTIGHVDCGKKAWERRMRCRKQIWNGCSYCLHFRDLPMLAQED